MKIKAKSKDGIVKVKMLLKHNMESGRRKDKKTGKLIPAHYITQVSATANGEQVFHAELGTAISKNPYIAFSYKGDAGGTVQVSWVDSMGKTKSAEATIK